MANYELGKIRTDRGEFIDKGNYVVDIRHPDFAGGAKADSGVTDNAPAITAAMNLLAEMGGGILYIPHGQGEYYGLGSLLNFSGDQYSDIKIQGDGRGSWLKPNAPNLGVLGVLHIGGSSSYSLTGLEVRDIRISCYDDTGDSAKNFSCGFADGVLLENVYIDTSWMEGIYFGAPSNTRNVKIRNCHATRVGMSGLSAYNLNCSRASLIGCSAYDVGQFVEQTGYEFVCQGNHFDGAGSYGINMYSTWSGWQDAGAGAEQNSRRAVITGNTIADCVNGIVFLDPEGLTASGFEGNMGRCVISGNVFDGCRQAAVLGTYAGSPAVLFQDNLITDGDAGSSVKAAVEVVSYQTADNGNLTGPIVVKGNTFHKGTYPWNTLVQALDHNGYHVIEDNVVYGKAWGAAGGAAFTIGGTRAVVQRNTFVPNGDTLDGTLLSILGRNGQGQNFVIGTDCVINKPFTYGGLYNQNVVHVPGGVPTVGYWKPGDVGYASAPVASGTMGSVCVNGGSAGTLATTLSADHVAGTAVATLTSVAGIYPGARLSIGGTSFPFVESVSGNVVTFTATFGAHSSGAAVTYSSPTFKTFGAIAA